MKHNYMPISISMTGRRCLVVGGGTVALRKVESLLDYESSVTVVAPVVSEAVEDHANAGRLTLNNRDYQAGEAADYGFVISATDDSALNKQVCDDARKAGVLVNVADDPPHCDFIFPAVLRRDCLTAAVSTDGKAPFVAGHLRAVLDDIFPEHWERLMKFAAIFRAKVRDRWPDDNDKKNACYDAFLQTDWKAMLGEMNNATVEAELERLLEQP